MRSGGTALSATAAANEGESNGAQFIAVGSSVGGDVCTRGGVWVQFVVEEHHAGSGDDISRVGVDPISHPDTAILAMLLAA